MASSKIKGITIEIGGNTTKLGKALEGVNKQSKDLQRELKGVNSLLKLDSSKLTFGKLITEFKQYATIEHNREILLEYLHKRTILISVPCFGPSSIKAILINH